MQEGEKYLGTFDTAFQFFESSAQCTIQKRRWMILMLFDV